MKKNHKKLQLHRETIRTLTVAQLARIHTGGDDTIEKIDGPRIHPDSNPVCSDTLGPCEEDGSVLECVFTV